MDIFYHPRHSFSSFWLTWLRSSFGQDWGSRKKKCRWLERHNLLIFKQILVGRDRFELSTYGLRELLTL